jgi:hypothetical protein
MFVDCAIDCYPLDSSFDLSSAGDKLSKVEHLNVRLFDGFHNRIISETYQLSPRYV